MTFTYDLLTLAMCDELSFACRVHVLIFSILQLSVPELCVTDHITFTWNGHCACAVSRDLSPGSKIIHTFEIPEPNLPIHFVTFTVLRLILSHVISGVVPLRHLRHVPPPQTVWRLWLIVYRTELKVSLCA